MAAKRLRLFPAPVIYREASSPSANIKPVLRWGYRFLVGKATRVIAQNGEAQAELRSLGVPLNSITVIPNPCPALTPPSPRDDQPLQRDATVLLSVGRLAPEKGIDRLIRAFRAYLRINPKARLVILGDGPERKKLESLVEDLGLRKAVNLAGFVRDVVPWYRRAGLFVLPSHYEGQPNALMEAIAHGCPVLCAGGKGGIRDIMDACGVGDCVIPDDSFERAFSEGVSHALAKDGACWQNARLRLTRMAHPEEILQRYLDACGISWTKG